MRKIVAILLVLAIACALFIVPAHAHDGDVELCGVALPCLRCREPMSTGTREAYQKAVSVSYCNYESHSHYHTRYYNAGTYHYCSACGYVDNDGYARTYCPYGGYFVE